MAAVSQHRNGGKDLAVDRKKKSEFHCSPLDLLP